ncbi:hypothetical protein [Paraoerskovia sediminicola]|uniref:hypothetical protein n=1 Tax=Paraoerskovia sediminicola TaxID=1138587 RepID=UPI002573E80B|nr:hypothetical protein [Paraoerskovia sediminicola]
MGAIDEDTGETIAPRVVPTWDEESRAGALDAATKTLDDFARPDLDFDAWWNELEPHLEPQAAVDYAYVDPANVPVRDVQGPARLVDDTSAYVAVVEVPTDAGDYAVTLVRVDGESPWLASRIVPVEDGR